MSVQLTNAELDKIREALTVKERVFAIAEAQKVSASGIFLLVLTNRRLISLHAPFSFFGSKGEITSQYDLPLMQISGISQTLKGLKFGTSSGAVEYGIVDQASRKQLVDALVILQSGETEGLEEIKFDSIAPKSSKLGSNKTTERLPGPFSFFGWMWAFCMIVVTGGTQLMNGKPFSAFCAAIAGLLFFPPFSRFVRRKLNYYPGFFVRVFIASIFVVAGGPNFEKENGSRSVGSTSAKIHSKEESSILYKALSSEEKQVKKGRK